VAIIDLREKSTDSSRIPRIGLPTGPTQIILEEFGIQVLPLKIGSANEPCAVSARATGNSHIHTEFTADLLIERKR
jgi:hypothetical protein